MERQWRAVTVLEGTDLLVEIVADAVGGRAAAGVIADAAVAVEGLVAAGGIVDVAGLAGDDTRTFCHGFTRIHTDRTKATMRIVAFLYALWMLCGAA